MPATQDGLAGPPISNQRLNCSPACSRTHRHPERFVDWQPTLPTTTDGTSLLPHHTLKETPFITSSCTFTPSHPFSLSKAGATPTSLPTRVVPASSPPDSRRGVTGATRLALDSAFALLPTLEIPCLMHLLGLSLAVNVTEPATHLRHDTITTAACQMLCSRLLRLVLGSRLTLCNFLAMPTPHSCKSRLAQLLLFSLATHSFR